MSITEETQRESYENIKPTTGQRRALILEILGDREMTANEIAEELFRRGYIPFYERNFAAPRLTELKTDGKVEVVGKRLCSKTNRTIAVWVKVEGADERAGTR